MWHTRRAEKYKVSVGNTRQVVLEMEALFGFYIQDTAEIVKHFEILYTGAAEIVKHFEILYTGCGRNSEAF